MIFCILEIYSVATIDKNFGLVKFKTLVTAIFVGCSISLLHSQGNLSSLLENPRMRRIYLPH